MIDLTRYRTPAGLVVNPADWATLRATVNDDELVAALCVASDGMPMPDADITEEQAMLAFLRLKAAPLTSLLEPGRIKLLRSPPTLQPDFHTCLRPPGNKASNYFFHKLRLRTPKEGLPSAWEKWHSSTLRAAVFRRLLKMKYIRRLDNTTIRLALHKTGATPAQFKPGVAKAIYELTRAKRVLDLSMGWGDRLAGFCASQCTEHYTGLDPNPDLHPIYKQQVAMYGSEKQFNFLNCPAEEMPAPPAESFDLAFTSPPYLGTERYGAGTGNESGQSWHRYPTPDAWRDGFLRPALTRSWTALKQGGVLALNIADTTHMSIYQPLCDWVRSITESLPGSIFHFALGMRLQSSNYSEERRAAESGEPIWMWSKGPRDLPWHVPGVDRPKPDRVALAAERAARKAAEAARPKAWWTRKGVRGSPPTPPEVIAQVLADYRTGLTPPKVAARNKLSKPTTYRILDVAGLRPRAVKPKKKEKPPG